MERKMEKDRDKGKQRQSTIEQNIMKDHEREKKENIL